MIKVEELSWREDDWDPEDLSGNHQKIIKRYEDWCSINELHSTCGILAGKGGSMGSETDSIPKNNPISTITINELFSAQLDDRECQAAREQIDKGSKTSYFIDERGLVVRVAPIDKAVQILVPVSLRPRALYLRHYTPVAGDHGASRQY